MNTDQPFHLWTIDQMLGEEPVPSTETADLSTAPLTWEERILLTEARVRSKAIDDYNAWVHEQGL